jgi:aryl-alcohol dehydrogenase-like predicted oxidoreductase
MSTTSQSQVEYRRLGKSGLRVSVPILGCMSYGSEKWQSWILNEDKVGAIPSETHFFSNYFGYSKALPLLKAAWERGVTTWDTANVYSNGDSERLIGKAMKEVIERPFHLFLTVR